MNESEKKEWKRLNYLLQNLNLMRTDDAQIIVTEILKFIMKVVEPAKSEDESEEE